MMAVSGRMPANAIAPNIALLEHLVAQSGQQMRGTFG
jgi:hypothetical protein